MKHTDWEHCLGEAASNQPLVWAAAAWGSQVLWWPRPSPLATCGNQPVRRVHPTSHFSAMACPRWLGRAVGNRHRHAVEQASRRWRGGRRDDSARTRRKLLISTQVGTITTPGLHGLRPRRLREAGSRRLERVLPAPHCKPKGRGLQGPLPPAAEARLRRRLAVGAQGVSQVPVSYTHLTLPTKRIV